MDNGVVRILRWVLIALGVLLLLSIIILLFTRPSGNKQNTGDSGSQAINLQDYAQNGSFRFVQNGAVTAPENNNSVTIAVSNSARSITVYNSYGANVVNSKTYPNSQASFDAFSNALAGAGFASTKSTNLNYSTFCTLGIRYSYQIVADNNMKLDSWNSSCNPRNGSFAGNASQVQQLFKLQIPDYNKVMNTVRL